MKTFDENYSIGAVRGRVRVDPRGWLDGDVLTPQGIVAVYSQHGDDAATVLNFAYGGREYRRTINGRGYSERGLAVVAGRFAAEVAQEVDHA